MGRGEKIESAAVEEDSGAVVEGVTEATGIGLEGLDFGVEALGRGVGDGEKREVEQFLGPIRFFVYEVVFFVVLVRYLEGAKPPFQSRQAHFVNLSPNWIANCRTAAFQVTGGFFHFANNALGRCIEAS